MEDAQDLDDLHEQLCQSAEQRGLLVFPEIIPEPETLVLWPGDPGDFVAFAADIPVRILYVQAFTLDQPSLEEVEDGLRDDSGEVAREDVGALRYARSQLGKPVLLTADFVVDGVTHRLSVEQSWWSELRERVSAAEFAEHAVVDAQRFGARKQVEAEINALVSRHDELVAGLAEYRAFYCATNEFGRNRAASDFDPELKRFLDPATRTDRHYIPAYSAALAVIRAANEIAGEEVRPRLIAQVRDNLTEIADRTADQFVALRTKPQRRHCAHDVLASEIGFAPADLVDALVDAVAERARPQPSEGLL